MLITALVFWFSVGLLLYTYVGFNLIVTVWSRARGATGRSVLRSDYEPTVTIVISALNEERVIEQRLINMDEVDYPSEKLEIIVASDGSSDRTVEIAGAHRGRPVVVLPFPERRGRPAIHTDAALRARGDILLFSDAETMLAPDFVRKTVTYFADPAYGCGAGDYSFEALGTFGENEGLYWRVEKRLRALEHRLGILPFASGGCLLVRKSLFTPIPSQTDLDCWAPYETLRRGYRVFYATDAKAYDVTIADHRAHYRKRVRTALKGLSGTLMALPSLAEAGRWREVWVLLSHRLIRWVGGYLLIIALVTNIALAGHGLRLYDRLLGVQVAFYAMAALGRTFERTMPNRRFLLKRVAAAVYAFVSANITFIVATLKLVRGSQITHYEPVSQL